MTRATARCLTVVLGGVLVLSACSQTAALAPVGGNRVAEVRFAALDVLTARQVSVLVAPVCSTSGPDDATISCQGTTADGQTITVTSTAAEPTTFEVSVGGTSVFRGGVTDVLQSAAEAS